MRGFDHGSAAPNVFPGLAPSVGDVPEMADAQHVQSFLNFFGLAEQPFAATADPAYYYATAAHRECLFHLWNTIDERLGIGVVLGNYGTGKTTLLRKLLTGMRAQPEKYNTVVIASPIPSWTSFSLLESITAQFGLQPETRSFVAYMDALYQYLLSSRDRITTLIIDDAQNLNKRGQLELLRLVQNLETAQHKLLNLVLFAQVEWIPVLRAAPNFEQRISMTYTLGSIGLQDTRNLIQFRLRQAGAGELAPVFDESAIRVIHAYADGSPRVTVTLARNALLLAYQLRTRQIGQAVVLHTIQRTTMPDEEKRARAANAVVASDDNRTVFDFTPQSEPVLFSSNESRRNGTSVAARANSMLLRAVRTHPDRVTHEQRF
ncbi:MAG TPA: AAA family ATPase [Candidatus Hydrogenedentes bacterium]|nr:AAA family ATPase [Candidatus Hydrogenedentota bacterium]HRK36558.1 AAA family ATPase [Candidatus Hydrogenedentota bacterium]